MARLETLCVFCGASTGADPAYRAAAAALGTQLAERGVRLVYGGGHVGLMGVLADAALAAGGEVVGVIPAHLGDRELAHKRASRMIVVDSMHSRKQRLFEMADAFAILPGGLGTLEEMFEVLTWKQLGMHDKPIVLIDVAGYWRPLQRLVAHAVGSGFARSAVSALFAVVDTPDQALATIAAAPESTMEANVFRL